jgi:hypothetical protein
MSLLTLPQLQTISYRRIISNTSNNIARQPWATIAWQLQSIQGDIFGHYRTTILKDMAPWTVFLSNFGQQQCYMTWYCTVTSTCATTLNDIGQPLLNNLYDNIKQYCTETTILINIRCQLRPKAQDIFQQYHIIALSNLHNAEWQFLITILNDIAWQPLEEYHTTSINIVQQFWTILQITFEQFIRPFQTISHDNDNFEKYQMTTLTKSPRHFWTISHNQAEQFA